MMGSAAEANTKIEILKNEKRVQKDENGREYDVEDVLIQVGEKHVMSITSVEGNWLHYQVSGSPGQALKPFDIERAWIEQLRISKARDAIKK